MTFKEAKSKEGTLVKSIDELKELLSGETGCATANCSVLLNGGFKSWKLISTDGAGRWWVVNEIDDTEDEFKTDEELMKSFIGTAIKQNALVFEWF